MEVATGSWLSLGGDELQPAEPPGAGPADRPQHELSVFLQLELCHSLGSYGRAAQGMRLLNERMEARKWAKPWDALIAREALELSLVLNTFAYAASRTAQWIFAAREEESEFVRKNYRKCSWTLTPTYCMWLAKQVSLIALQRRAYTGLTVRVGVEGHSGDDCRPIEILCSTCALDNDLVAIERFHRPDKISEVCIKGEDEGVFYDCYMHDPKRQAERAWVERMERYDPLGH